jgi:hypothetical protein
MDETAKIKNAKSAIWCATGGSAMAIMPPYLPQQAI